MHDFVKVTGNGNLDFDLIYMDYFEETPRPQGYSFPNFGFEYGVFGYVDSGTNPHNENFDYRGWVYSDDEDKGNANKITLWRQNSRGQIDYVCDIKPKSGLPGGTNNRPGLPEVRDGIDCLTDGIIEYSDGGTKIYMTRVNPKDIYD